MKYLSLSALIFITACETAVLPPADVLPPATADSCNAAQYENLIGKDATALERELIMRPVRIIRPGMAITMDYSPDRINFDISEYGKVARIWCG